MIESLMHRHSSFVTLTYRDECLPALHGPLELGSQWGLGHMATLSPTDLKNWLKRLREGYNRKINSDAKLRYFACGEYGDKHGRPHYHLALFGYAPCAYGKSRYADGRTIDCCASCDLIRDTWAKGKIEVEPLTDGRCAYVAGYIMKKMTSKADARLDYRQPEFTRQSTMRGLGSPAVELIAKTIRPHLKADHDVPTHLRIGEKKRPLGRYLRRQLRKALGRPEDTPQAFIAEYEAELFPLRQAALTDPEALTLKQQIRKRSKGKLASLSSREQIHNSRNRGNL